MPSGEPSPDRFPPGAPLPEGPFAFTSPNTGSRFPFWGYLDLLLFLGTGIAGLFTVGILMAVILRMIPSWRPRLQLFELPLMLLLYGVLSFALWVIIRVRYEKPVWRSLGWNPSRIPAWQALLGGCVLSFVIGALGALLKTPQIRSPFDKFLQTPVWIVIFGVFAVFLGPLFEEVVFRGFVQPLLARDLGSFPGIFVTAAAFGALHGSQYSWAWQYIALVTAAGVCFGAVRQWGGSLTPSIFMHAGFNAIFFIAALVQTQIQK